MNMRQLIKKPLLREGATLVGLYWLYSSIRWFVARDTAYEAVHNAYKVIELERQLGIFHEPNIQAWLLRNATGLVKFANSFYTFGYFPILGLMAIVLYRFYPERFHVFKLTFLLGLGFALIGFSVFPLAPPRMLPEFGFVDTQELLSDSFYNQKTVLSFYNPYAAMPSLHFGWALLIGIAAFSFNRYILKVFGVLYPAMMALVIVTTGHHYLLDVIGGGIVVSLAYKIVRTAPSLAKSRATGLTRTSQVSYNNEVLALSVHVRSKPPNHRWSKEKQKILQQNKLRVTLAAYLTNQRPPV
jgi:membrane-associated phospholipid phosphatase